MLRWSNTQHSPPGLIWVFYRGSLAIAGSIPKDTYLLTVSIDVGTSAECYNIIHALFIILLFLILIFSMMHTYLTKQKQVNKIKHGSLDTLTQLQVLSLRPKVKLSSHPISCKAVDTQMNQKQNLECQMLYLVGGFNPSEKYSSKWESSPNRVENKKYLKPPPSLSNYYRQLWVTWDVFNLGIHGNFHRPPARHNGWSHMPG